MMKGYYGIGPLSIFLAKEFTHRLNVVFIHWCTPKYDLFGRYNFVELLLLN